MNTRLLVSHLAVAALALGVGYAVFAPHHGVGGAGLTSSSDPVARFAEILQIEDAHVRAQALVDFFADADPAWAERLRAEVNQPESKVQLDELSEVLFASWWAKSDPQAAFKHLADPAWSNRHPWIRETMRAWVAVDPAHAAEAAQSLPPNPDRGKVEASRVLVEHWWDNPASTDPTPLMGLLHTLEVGPRAAAIERLLQSLVEHRGLDEAEKFVAAIPKQEDFGVSVQQEMMARMAAVLLQHDVERAKRWATAHGEGRDGSGVLRHLAFYWGVKDGPAAMEWAMALPDTFERAGILLRVWLSFRQAHPEEATDWLLAHEPDEVLEGIYQRYLSGTAGHDAKRALEIAEKTKDPATRERLLAAIGVGWMKVDPDAARKWLDTVELLPEHEEQILRTPPAASTAPPLSANSGG